MTGRRLFEAQKGQIITIKTELSRHDIETRLGVNHSVVNRLVHERQVHMMIEHLCLFVPDIV